MNVQGWKQFVVPWAVVIGSCQTLCAEIGKPYRLEAVDLEQRVIWGVEVLDSPGGGLAFGGQDQEAEDGRPHTRVLVEGKWVAIHENLRAANPLQPLHERVWTIRNEVKKIRAQVRGIFFRGMEVGSEQELLKGGVAPRIEEIREAMSGVARELDEAGGSNKGQQGIQIRFALTRIRQAQDHAFRASGGLSTADGLRRLRTVQEELELAAEALDAEPPPRSLDCGSTRQDQENDAGSKGLVYDPKSKLYILFGGDHLDYLTNDTWVFDPALQRWFQRHPGGAPPPRANHRLVAKGDGTIVMTGGYTYTSNTDYVGGQYADLKDGPWTYDVIKNEWTGGSLVPSDSRTYRSGPFHPAFYQQGPEPDAAAFAEWLGKLPVNEWVATDPPYKPRQNRDWGMAIIDPERDLMLRWSGGHSAHGGTDVPHFHFATNRWELPFPVEFPLGQLYSNTSYPDGYNYNLRPWMTGHTYQNYQFDAPSKLMVKAGRPRHFYLYDPERGDWIGRGKKPPGMVYDSCFYTLTLTSTPQGALCWGANGKVHLYEHAAGKWNELALQGETLPGAVVDNSTIAYDAKRHRILMVQKPYGNAPFSGEVWSLDLATRRVSALSPQGMSAAHRIAYIDRCVYDPDSDLLLFASYLNEEGERTGTPAYDPGANRWVTLDLGYQTGRRGDRVTRDFPHGRSCGIMHDARRHLIWGTDTNSQVYVLRFDRKTARERPLE